MEEAEKKIKMCQEEHILAMSHEWCDSSLVGEKQQYTYPRVKFEPVYTHQAAQGYCFLYQNLGLFSS